MRTYFEKALGDFRIIRNTQSDYWYPSHIHKGVELVFVFSGELSMQLGKDGYNLEKGDLAVVFPGVVHNYNSNGFSDFWLAVFDPYYVHPLFRRSLDTAMPTRPVLRACEVPGDIYLSVEKTLELQGAAKLPVCAMWLQIILAEIFPLVCIKRSAKKSEDMSLVSKITAYITQHFLEPVTLDTLAQELQLNHYYVSHVFSENFHMTLPQYVNLLRIDYAVDLMRNTDLTLTQIWVSSGFQTQRNFHRAFVKIKGVSPSEYRKTLPQMKPQFPDDLSRTSLGGDHPPRR